MAKTPRKSSKSASVSRPETGSAPLFFLNVRLQSILLFVFACALYANTVSHGFVLDDELVVTNNAFVKKGVAGIGDIFSQFTLTGQTQKIVYGDRYRPLTPALFAIVYEGVGEKPWPYHLLCVLLFAGTAVLAYRTAVALLSKYDSGAGALLTAALAGWLFAAHPIHTEVVANIKSCDETAALALSLGALWLILRAFDSGRTLFAGLGGLVFFAGLFAKENTVTFLAVIPLALWFFRKASFRQVAVLLAPALAATVVWLLIRMQVVSSPDAAPMSLINNPFIEMKDNQWVALGVADRLATVFYTLGKYVQLLIFPHPLTSDYYPRMIPVMHFSSPLVWLSLAVYIAGAWYALAGWRKGKTDPVRFGILYFFITLSIVSNLFFTIGTNMAERFIFMPSWGFCLAAGALLAGLALGGRKTLALGLTGLVLVLFSVKTVWRNFDWKSNRTLFFKDVEVSGNSAKIQNGCGYLLIDDAMKEKDPVKRQQLINSAIKHLDKALEVFPWYIEAFYMRGNAYYLSQNYAAAVENYKNAYQLNAKHEMSRNNLALSLRELAKQQIQQRGDLKKIIDELTESHELFGTDPETVSLLGNAYMFAGQYQEAIKYFTTWRQLQPNNPAAAKALAQAYTNAGETAAATEILNQLPPGQ